MLWTIECIAKGKNVDHDSLKQHTITRKLCHNNRERYRSIICSHPGEVHPSSKRTPVNEIVSQKRKWSAVIAETLDVKPSDPYQVGRGLHAFPILASVDHEIKLPEWGCGACIGTML